MNMTHYMQLLADNQPWNLLIFMAIPVVLAETLAITELYLLFTRRFDGAMHALNRVAGIVVGLYFIGVIAYLVPTAVWPLTISGQWRTFIDVVAVLSYLIGGLPLIWIALQELGLVNRTRHREDKLKVHATCVAIFLVFGHIAMIAGMTDPGLFGYVGEGHGHGMAAEPATMGAPPASAPAAMGGHKH